MGLDVEIFAKTKGGTLTPELERDFPAGFTLVPVRDYDIPEGATVQVDTCARYYGVGYERGPWPSICAVLMLLIASPDVEQVWYTNDAMEAEGTPPLTIDDVLSISRHFMLNGERPYRNRD